MVYSGSWASFMAVALIATVLVVDSAAAEVHKVGDSAGWTILGNPNYTAWASTKSFHVGDTLVFEYNKQFHNVMEVNKTDYQACNPSSPKKTYTTGNDSITIMRKGHYFFICGFPGHCSLGQKVDIRIPKPAPTPSATPSPSTSSPPGLAPHGSHASSSCIGGGWALPVVVLAALTCLVM